MEVGILNILLTSSKFWKANKIPVSIQPVRIFFLQMNRRINKNENEVNIKRRRLLFCVCKFNQSYVT